MTIEGSLDKIHDFDENYWAFRNQYNAIVQRFASSSFLSPNLTHQANIHGVFFGVWVNLRHKLNKISRYFHGLFCTLITFALHELVNEHYLLQINLISLCHKSCAGEHPLYLHSFGTSLDNGK